MTEEGTSIKRYIYKDVNTTETRTGTVKFQVHVYMLYLYWILILI